MLKMILAAVAAFSVTASADVDGRVSGGAREEIMSLSRDLMREARNGFASEAAYQQAAMQLREVLYNLQNDGQGDPSNDECINYVSGAYKAANYGLDTAYARGKSYCAALDATPMRDFYFFQYVAQQYTRANYGLDTSFNKAIDNSKLVRTFSQINCVKKVAQDYVNNNYGLDTAFSKAQEFCRQ